MDTAAVELERRKRSMEQVKQQKQKIRTCSTFFETELENISCYSIRNRTTFFGTNEGTIVCANDDTNVTLDKVGCKVFDSAITHIACIEKQESEYLLVAISSSVAESQASLEKKREKRRETKRQEREAELLKAAEESGENIEDLRKRMEEEKAEQEGDQVVDNDDDEDEESTKQESTTVLRIVRYSVMKPLGSPIQHCESPIQDKSSNR